MTAFTQLAQAARLAREALGRCRFDSLNMKLADMALCGEAADALDAALAAAQAVAEPVATVGPAGLIYNTGALPLPLGTKLYTSPPAQAPAEVAPADEVELIAKHIEENWKLAERDPRDIAKDIRTLIRYYRSAK